MTQQEFQNILEVGVMLSSERDLDKLLARALDCVMDLARCDAGTLYLLEGDKLAFKLMRNRSRPIGTLPPVPLSRENVCALAFLEGRTVSVDDVYENRECDFTGPLQYDAQTGYRTRSMLVVPMIGREGEKLGVLQLINALDESGAVVPFPADMTLVLESVASQTAVTVQNVRYVEEIHELFHSFVRVMSAAIGELTPYNASHTRHMAAYCGRFLDYLNESAGYERFDAARREELLTSVWLHDVGKLVTPLEVMNKAGRLRPEQRDAVFHRLELIRLRGEIDCLRGRATPEELEALKADTFAAQRFIEEIDTADRLDEGQLARVDALAGRSYTEADGSVRPWLTEEERRMLSIRGGTLSPEERQIMENHVVLTDRLLSQIHFSRNLSHVRQWAASHHELLNGRGYPEHLSGDQIPEEVRIITILDIFDALVASDRPYKAGKPVPVALAILKDMAAQGRLDAELLEQFEASRCWEAGEDEK